MKRHAWAIQPNINKENVPQQHVTLPQTFPCQKDGSRPCKRKPETNSAAMGRAGLRGNSFKKPKPEPVPRYRPDIPQSAYPQPLATAAEGATNFAGLFGRSGEASAQARGVRPAPRTFLDIASRPSEEKGTQLEQRAGSSMLEMLKEGANSRHAAEAAQRVGGAAPSHLEDAREVALADAAQLDGLAEPPIDWSLKTSLRISSPAPFRCVEQAGHSRTGTVCSATRSFCGAQAECLQQERIHHALLSWQHPEATLERNVVALLQGGKSGSLVADRRAAWQEAFRGLFYALRNCLCDAFYLETPPGATACKPFTVLFQAAGVAGQPRTQAALSRSTAGLRTSMREGHGLRFSMPAARVPHGEPQQDKLAPDEAELVNVQASTALAGVDNTAKSLLLFDGAEEVHGLFDFLLNEATRICGSDCDVPQLLAPVAFPGACLKQHSVRMLPPPSEVGKVGQHRMEVRGLLPPWVVTRLVSAIAATHDQPWQVLAETDALTGSFNRPAAADKQCLEAEGHWHSRGGLCSCAAQQKWHEAEPRMAGLVMRELRWMDHCFTARLLRCRDEA